MTDDRKPLRTSDEIYAAYPEHKKLFEKEAEIELLKKFVHALADADFILCREEKDPTEKYPIWILASDMGQYSRGMQNFIWRQVGVDPDRIWAEKTDMLAQLKLAQEDK